MRHLNPASQKMSRVHIFVFVLSTFAIATSGCSKLQQQTNFRQLSQPRSLSDHEKQSVESILQRQDEVVRIANEKAAAEAAALAEAEAEAALETEATETSSVETSMNADFNVAQVSFETEIEDTTDDVSASEPQAEPNIETNQFGGFSEFVADSARGLEAIEDISSEAMAEFDSASESLAQATLNENVTLTANVDDLEGVPFNIARDDMDLSTANFLRPSTDPELSQLSPSDAETVPEVAPAETPTSPESFNSDPPNLPLQPMLFNASTRARNAIVQGTLRPLGTERQDLEPEVSVEKTESVAVSPSPALPEPNLSPLAFGPLAPLRNPNTIQLESREVEPADNQSLNSRLLEPIARTVEPEITVEAEAFEIPKTDFMPEVKPIEVVATEPKSEMVSEEIIVVDPTPPPQPAPVEESPRVAAAPVAEPAPFAEAAPEVTEKSGHPVVDESLAQASASYLQATAAPPVVFSEEEFIPTEVPMEVLEDAEIVVGDIEQELEANSIPVESFPVVDNDFKIRPTSNTAPLPVEVVEEELGEPMFENNDFAAPDSPGVEFVPPMTIVPAEVPTIAPKSLNPVNAEFGGDVSLDAPPETDTVVAHVAALPVTEQNRPAVTNSKVPPVGVSTLMELNAVTWKSRLDEAIVLAGERLNRMNNPADSMVVNLRLLKALRGQMEQMETSSGTNQRSENESQYWQHQLEAITSMLGSPTGANQAITDYHRHQTAHETLEHLRNAVSQLESIASLKVGSGQFCTEITGFGQFRTFASNQFSAGQKMLVYCEVENYNTVASESATGTEFRTRLKGSFAIYDANGKVVQQAEYPTVDDIARKRRRDFYMYMPVTLGDLPSGQYVLHALVEDIYGNKTASLDPPLQFSVK